MADFFRVVRCLVNFSLVAKRTKHVSKVREVIRRCEKICEDDILTLLMTSHTQNVTSWFFGFQFLRKITDFMARLVRWPVDKNSPYVMRITKLIYDGYGKKNGVSWATSRICLIDGEKVTFFVVFGPKRSLQSIWHDVMASKKCENDASWSRFCVKVREICYF